jgi:hypothetical protein
MPKFFQFNNGRLLESSIRRQTKLIEMAPVNLASRNDKEKPRSLASEMGREAVMLGAGGGLEAAVLGGLALRRGGALRAAMGKGAKNVPKVAMGRNVIKPLARRIGRDAFGASIFGVGLGAAQHEYDVKDYRTKQKELKESRLQEELDNRNIESNRRNNVLRYGAAGLIGAGIHTTGHKYRVNRAIEKLNNRKPTSYSGNIRRSIETIRPIENIKAALGKKSDLIDKQKAVSNMKRWGKGAALGVAALGAKDIISRRNIKQRRGQ